MNKIYIIYRGELDEYTIEDKFLEDEIKGIMTDTEVTTAFVNGEKIK